MRKLPMAMLAFMLLASSAILTCAADNNPAFTNAKEAGADFAIPGEYVGGTGEEKWGGQVIALGDGKFEAIAYKGGLPGDGWKRGDETRRAMGELKDGVASFAGEGHTAKIEGDTVTVLDLDGKRIGQLKKVHRESPTLGAKPPEGAIVLFDGTTADNFTGGKLIEDNLLGATNCESKQKFQDHTLHIEFRTPFMPKSRGQARGNSGVYMHCRYECQVLDSFGLEGENNECGGIYQLGKPIVNMCYPPLSWQTYDIDFTAARYEGDKKVANARCTIRHNGVLIHDNLDLKHATPGRAPEGPGPMGIFLQNHGNPVAFRNIWVLEKK